MPNSFINVRPPQSLFSNAEPADQIGGFTGGGSFIIIESWGVISSLGTTDASSTFITSSTGHGIRQNSGGIVGDAAFLSRSVNYSYQMGVFLRYKFRISHTTDIRFFGGTTDISLGLITGDSALNSMGIHYSTPNGDSNFQFFSQGAGPSLRTDSGIPADTLPHIVDVFYYPNSRIEFKLYDSLLNFQASGLHDTVFPDPAGSFDFNFGVETQAAAPRSIDQYKCDVILKPKA